MKDKVLIYHGDTCEEVTAALIVKDTADGACLDAIGLEGNEEKALAMLAVVAQLAKNLGL